MGIKVFFNDSCSVCRLEINHYKKISDNNLEWIDITNNDDALKITSKTQEELLRRLHVCLLYTSPSPRDRQKSRMPSSA